MSLDAIKAYKLPLSHPSTLKSTRIDLQDAKIINNMSATIKRIIIAVAKTAK